ncbi:MAG TPA: hypothetical protein VHO69_13980 [Phototrophicaceae bacterium]|nr:hypothetical protein [Phototrophicaceae bacterium]
MRKIRRLLLALAFIALVIAVVLLLNFTAPNPTGRRYSSEMPVTTGQGNSSNIGLSGERVLAQDLKLPRNVRKDQLQCICNSPSYRVGVGECRVCLAYTQSVATYRRPDFVSANFIAESKNSQDLLYTGREVDQITDYVFAARAMNIPLWVFVRVDTKVDAEFVDVVASTGGGVVPYFTVPGYADPVDQAAQRVALGAAGMLLVTGLWEIANRRQPRTVTVPATNPPAAPRRPKSPNPLGKADAADDFIRRSKDRARGIIDTDDTWSEID